MNTTAPPASEDIHHTVVRHTYAYVTCVYCDDRDRSQGDNFEFQIMINFSDRTDGKGVCVLTVDCDPLDF